MRSDGTGGGAPPITVPTDQKIIEELVKFGHCLSSKKNNVLF